jgi:hypothetical protein
MVTGRKTAEDWNCPLISSQCLGKYVSPLFFTA